MKKNVLLLLAVIAFVTVSTLSCENPEPLPGPDQNQPEQVDTLEQKPTEEPAEPIKLENIVCTVESDPSRVFEGNPLFNVHIENPNDTVLTATVTLKVSTDKGVSVETLEKDVELPAKGTADINIAPENTLEPGFYKTYCYAKSPVKNTPIVLCNYIVGVSPYDIVSEPDMQDDFDEFWAAAKAQLPELKEGETVNLIEIANRSSDSRKVYLVEMQSVPNGLDGEPVIVRGFYVEPQDGKKHPVLMHFFGWDDRNGAVTVPSGGSGDFAEFYLSHRGQYHNNRQAPGEDKWKEAYEKKYEGQTFDWEWSQIDPCTYASILDPSDKYNWFGFNFGDKDGYYYRGAFMDCVQAVRFMASRPTSDMNNLFGEGSSQGGALSYATAALSDYPFVAIAPNVAFLGDYPDYFDIVSWPGNVAKDNQGTMTDEEMYAFLSYFDTKNLATRISCAVHASSGLADGTCPPHTNFAPFNNLNTEDKVMIIEPKMGHSYPAGWEASYMKFFKERMK